MKDILSLENLVKKPTEDMYIEESKIKNVTLIKNFHFGGTLHLNIVLKDCMFLGNLYFSPMKIFNLTSLLLELFKDSMDSCETLSLEDLKGLPCLLVWENDPKKAWDSRILAIGNTKGEYIFVDEIIELLK